MIVMVVVVVVMVLPLMLMARWFGSLPPWCRILLLEGRPPREGTEEGGGGRVVYGGVICSSTDTNIDDVN